MDATKTRGVTMDVTNEEERASSSHARCVRRRPLREPPFLDIKFAKRYVGKQESVVSKQ